MGSGALVLVWSHPFTYANISLLSLHDTVTFPSSLRFSIVISSDEDRFDTVPSKPRPKDTLFTTEPGKKNSEMNIKRMLARTVLKFDAKKGCNTRTSQEVTHPSTTLAQARLTSEF